MAGECSFEGSFVRGLALTIALGFRFVANTLACCGWQLAFMSHNVGAFLGPAVLGASVHLFGLEAAAYTYGTLAIAAGVAIGWYAKRTASLDDEPTINASALVDFQLLFTL